MRFLPSYGISDFRTLLQNYLVNHHNLMSDHLLHNKITQLIRQHQLLDPGDRLIVGTSGGLDSTALLHLLHSSNLDLQLIAVYVDHGLRPEETDKEIRFISMLSKTLSIAHYIKSVDVTGHAKRYGCSIEESGRILRHQALEDVRKETKAKAIALGHTADDQVEEFFIRLVRGSGLKGLSGMLMKSGHLIRPLLQENKSDLLTYLNSIDQNFCHDSSNDSRTFLRNRVRLDLIPLLQNDFNPSISNTVRETMSILQDEEELLNDICQEAFYRHCLITTNRVRQTQPIIAVNYQALQNEHRAIQKRVLEKICWKMNTSPSTRIIHQLLELAFTSQRGSQIHLSKGLRVKKEADLLIFEYPQGRQAIRGKLDYVPDFSYEITGPGNHYIAEIDSTVEITEISEQEVARENNQIFLSSDKISYPLTVRTVEKGERFTPAGAPGSKKINRFLTDQKIPGHKKSYYPVISDKKGVVAIACLRASERVQPQPGDIKVTRLSITRGDIKNRQEN